MPKTFSLRITPFIVVRLLILKALILAINYLYINKIILILKIILITAYDLFLFRPLQIGTFRGIDPYDLPFRNKRRNLYLETGFEHGRFIG